MGAFPIPFSEIAAWCHLSGERLDTWELLLLHRMEEPRLKFLNGEAPKSESPPLTPSLFKSMFSKG